MLQPVGHVQQKIPNATPQAASLCPEGHEPPGSASVEDLRLLDEETSEGSGRGQNWRGYVTSRRERKAEKIRCVRMQWSLPFYIVQQ